MAQVPVIQKMLNTVEAPLTQLVDMVVDVSMIAVPMIPSVQKTVEVPQVQHVEKTVDAQIVDQRRQWRKPHAWLHRNTQTSARVKKKMSVKTESLAGDINEEVSVPPPQVKLVQVAPNTGGKWLTPPGHGEPWVGRRAERDWPVGRVVGASRKEARCGEGRSSQEAGEAGERKLQTRNAKPASLMLQRTHQKSLFSSTSGLSTKASALSKSPFGEIVFVRASAVQGAEVLTINIDVRVQVVSDHARAKGEGGIEHEESGDRTRGDRCGVHGRTSPFHPSVKQNLSKLLVPTNASLLHCPP